MLFGSRRYVQGAKTNPIIGAIAQTAIILAILPLFAMLARLVSAGPKSAVTPICETETGIESCVMSSTMRAVAKLAPEEATGLIPTMSSETVLVTFLPAKNDPRRAAKAKAEPLSEGEAELIPSRSPTVFAPKT